MVHNYKWRREGEIKYDVDKSGNLSPGAATRMRMVALTPRGSLRRAAGSLSTQGYSSSRPTQFEAQALERELMPGFASYFTDKVQPACRRRPKLFGPKSLRCSLAVVKLLLPAISLTALVRAGDTSGRAARKSPCRRLSKGQHYAHSPWEPCSETC